MATKAKDRNIEIPFLEYVNYMEDRECLEESVTNLLQLVPMPRESEQYRMILENTIDDLKGFKFVNPYIYEAEFELYADAGRLINKRFPDSISLIVDEIFDYARDCVGYGYVSDSEIAEAKARFCGRILKTACRGEK